MPNRSRLVGISPMPPVNPRGAERRFFMAAAIFLLLFVFAGFSRTFYLHGAFGQPAPIRYLEFHGLVMSGWIVLVFAQTALVSAGRTKLHRRIGYAGAIYAALMIPIACAATVMGSIREVRGHTDYAPSELVVLALEFTQMLLFGALVGAAVWWRNRPDVHKRLIIMATLCILPNVLVRLILPILRHGPFVTNLAFLVYWTALVAAFIGIDTWRNRRLHPAFKFGGGAAIAALYLAWFIGGLPVWQQFWMRALS